MIKVLHIGEYVSGGVAVYLKTLIEESKESDIKNYLLMSSYKSDKNWRIDKNKITFYSYKRNFFRLIIAMIYIYSHIKKVQPDIIHVHSSWAGVMVRILYLCKKRREKIIYTPHGWSFIMENPFWKRKIYGLIEKTLSLVTDEIVNVSKYEEKKAIEYGIPFGKMSVIYNGVKEPIKKNNKVVNMKEDKLNLLFVGRLDYSKGLDIFLKTYYMEEFSKLHLYIIGKSILEKNEIRSDNRTTYLGWIDNEELDLYYEACDVVVMPSRWEGFGLVAIEAMRNEKPIIASNRGALPELIENKKHGYIFDIDNPIELKNILMGLDKENLKNMGKLSKERYAALFTAKKMQENIYFLYRKITNAE